MIPEWEEIQKKVLELDDNKAELTALERFVYENEPLDGPGTRRFRKGLEAVIAEVQAGKIMA